MTSKTAVKIVKDTTDPQPTEIMERAIVDVAEGARKMLGGRLNQRAISVLLKDATGVPMETINRVLDSAARLDRTYLKAAVLFVAVAGLSACAGLQQREKPIVARCNEQVQWTTKDDAGNAVGIFVCFGEHNQLLYVVRQLPPAPPELTPEQRRAAKIAAFKAEMEAKGVK
jgi:hypothetical protein